MRSTLNTGLGNLKTGLIGLRDSLKTRNENLTQMTPDQQRAAGHKFDMYTGQPLTLSSPSMGTSSRTSSYQDELDRFSPEAIAGRRKVIMDEASSRRQGVIDAINSVYGGRADRIKKTGELATASQRSINLRSGLGGSDFGSANKAEIKTQTDAALAASDAEKTTAIADAINGIESLATQQADSAEESLRTGSATRLDLQEKIYNEAKGRLKTLASNAKASAEYIKSTDPKLYDSIRKTTGMTDMEIDSFINENLPDEFKIKYEQEVIAGPSGDASLLKYGVDPRTGKVTKSSYDLGVPYEDLKGVQTKEVDGVLYKFDPVKKTFTAVTPKYKSATGAGSQTDQYKANVSAAISKLNLQLGQPGVLGADRKLSPDNYRKARQRWLDAGLLLGDFETNFNQYIDYSHATDYYSAPSRNPQDEFNRAASQF